MRATSERHSPERVKSIEERVIHVIHVYAYRLVREYARTSDRVLEVGFGEGYGSELIPDSIGEYHGIEVSRDAVEHASARYGGAGRSFHHYDGRTFPFDDDSFDLVISFQVIEHVVDQQAYLTEIRRTCRDGGKVLIVTPNRNHRLDGGERPWNRYHVVEFSPSELRSLLTQRFDEVELFGIHGTPLIDEIEKKRVGRARRLARLDRLGLRYLLPEAVDTRVRTMLKWKSNRGVVIDPAEIKESDVSHSREAVETSLDILAVGKNLKSRA